MTRHFSVAIMALFSTIGCSAPTSAGPDASNVTEKAMANAAMPQAPSAVAEQAPQNPLPGADREDAGRESTSARRFALPAAHV